MTEIVAPSGALSPEAVLHLPGARRHCARVLADLRAGLTCVWLFSDAEVESGRADRAVEAVVHGLDDVVEAPPRKTGTYVVPEPWEPPGGGGVPAARSYDDALDVDDGFGDWDPFGLSQRGAGAGADRAGGAYGDAGAHGDAGPHRAGSAPAGALLTDPTVAPGLSSPTPPPGPEADVAVRLADSLSLPGDLVSELIAGADRRAPVLVVRAWAEEDPLAVSRLVRRFQAAVKEAGLKPGEHPRLLVASRAQDLEVDTVGLLDGAVARPHWWWGVWSHLDTATVVAEAVSHTGAGHVRDRMTPGKLIRHALRCETVAQVAGPDLELAVDLARVWSGRTEDLAAALGECGAGAAGPVEYARTASGAAYAPFPEQGVREAWSAGLVDSWEGQVRLSPRSGAAEHEGPELDKLVWQAQNRVLLPLVDDARLGFVELLPRIAARGTARLVETYVRQSLRGANGAAADLASMELGELFDAAVHRDICLTDTQFRRLRTLRLARNKLAHRTPLDDALLRDLLDALSGF